ncbi:MAG: terminase family protein, partial [Ottowia sp.]|nr:terminase family protein [Ottowia sp.]
MTAKALQKKHPLAPAPAWGEGQGDGALPQEAVAAPAIQLYGFQKRWVLDDARFKIGMMARQCGKTFTSTLEAVKSCLYEESWGQRDRWVILSRGERQAREAIQEGVKPHLLAMQSAFELYELPFDSHIKAHEVELPGGSRITALPANPDTARGYSSNVILDEFAFHKDSHAIWRALFPVISKPGLKLRVISTPNGKSGKFYELMTGKDDGWSRHVVDIYQAVKDGLPRDIEELRRGAGDPDLWAQEFELKWLDEASAWLSYELIAGCEHDSAGHPEHYQGGPVYVGVDIAARRDLFVIWVLEQVGDVLWARELIERRRASFAEQDALLEQVFRRYRVLRCCIDQTGMGEKPVEDAKRKHGSSRVEGVLFTAANKLQLATIGRAAFEDKKLRIPDGNAELRADLHKLQKVTGPTGTPRFVAASDASGHADRAWALFLALSAAQHPAPIDYIPVPRRTFDDTRRADDD